MRLTLRKVQAQDVRDLFDWRNHPQVRRNSFSTKPLVFSEHQKWFTSKLKSPTTTIYMASQKGVNVGVIRFEDETHHVQVNVMVNPEFFGRGFGTTLIRLGTERFYKEKQPGKPIVAEIKPDNAASLKAFEKAGYVLSHLNFVSMGNPKSESRNPKQMQNSKSK